MQDRTPAPLPSDPAALRALYTRVHWLVIADTDRVVAANVASLREPAPGDDFVRRLSDALRARAAEYQASFDQHMREPAAESARVMTHFVENAREVYGEQPEFGFLFV